ncbi:MAG: alpha/beta hydrolase [Ruminococcus sp.]|uniref:alpha/beta hydrolase n=1 Tax=Ruminococcus sp. TaxID=41978 RepID=UPI002873C9B2|nr:alpha/beta hydrolase [Ruminococcus sp.]MBQ3285309.1 alpha/beta hydrolase [Ruminococcus sp.]
MVKVIDKEVLSSDKVHYLKGRIYIPEGSPKGLLHVVHGMTEYIGRYDGFMREMAEFGYITFGYDHLGHGMTAVDESELGFIAHKGGWNLLVDDVFLFGNEIRKAMSGEKLPFILMGHSMGSFIVRLTAARYQHHDKLIVMGTGGPNPAAGAGIAACGLLKAVKGERSYSKLIYSMAFGSYNKGFEHENDQYAWLSVSKENRDNYRRDPLCTFQFTVSAMQDLVRLNKYSNDKSWFYSMDRKKPIMLVSGGDDPVGENGSGVKKVYEHLKAAGVNVKMKLYDGYRHELLQDYCREEVIRDIKDFVEKA